MDDATILVVDDDPSIREVVASLLEMEGYAVLTASNGLEALRVLERQMPNLVLLDMRMPVMDGWTFARELHRRGLDLPLLVLTASQDAHHWAEQVGAEDFLEKPFEITSLLASVKRLNAA
jgi:CheY-like chemotaxis protein